MAGGSTGCKAGRVVREEAHLREAVWGQILSTLEEADLTFAIQHLSLFLLVMESPVPLGKRLSFPVPM